MQQMVGQNGNPDMAVAAVFRIMEKRSQSEVAFEQPESAFHFSQGNVYMPDFIVGQIRAAASQMITAVQFGIRPIFIVITTP